MLASLLKKYEYFGTNAFFTFCLFSFSRAYPKYILGVNILLLCGKDLTLSNF
jgi:hypothetical protein